MHAQNTYSTADTTPPTNPTATSTNDKVNALLPLIEDQKDTLRLMQRMDPICKHMSKRLFSDKAHSHDVDTFTHIKGLICQHMMDSSKRILALVIPKYWHFTVLV